MKKEDSVEVQIKKMEAEKSRLSLMYSRYPPTTHKFHVIRKTISDLDGKIRDLEK